MKGTLLRPAWPRTVNVPATRQTGETCLTVKTTRAASGSRKVSVVRRRAFGPRVAIQGRELRRCAIELRPPVRRDEDCCEFDPEPELPVDAEPTVDRLDAMPAIGAVAGAEGMDGADGTDGVEGTDGEVGRGGGAGRDGTGTGRAGVGTVGVGRTSAKAVRAPMPAATITTAAAAHRTILGTSITLITRFGLFRLRAKCTSMRTPKADYYDLLGVSRDADPEAIRAAFHGAAQDVHPDVSDSLDTERRFRDLAEAYSVLSKPALRLLYDRYGYRGRGNTAFDEALWDAREGPPRGESIHLPLELRAFEAADGGSRLVRYQAARICSACHGRGSMGERDPDCPSCGGTGRRSHVSDLGDAQFLLVEPCFECGGEVCPECGGSGREYVELRLMVRVPSGIDDGAQLRVRGEGDVGARGGAPGDLLLDVRVLPQAADRRLVRYLASALFLIAIALLCAYLLLR